MHYPRPLSLSSKLSIVIVVAVILSVGILGVYFDYFLKAESFNSASRKMEYGFQRLQTELRHIENELREGIAFIQNDESALASIELINNYQDKEDYNTILLDEEKKSLVRELLKRVKLSLNDTIVLYDRNQELIAFVMREEREYRLSFISYRHGIPLLLSRLEREETFREEPYHDHPYIDFMHTDYYQNLPRPDEALITYRFLEKSIHIKSHQNLLEPGTSHVIAHIEMTRRIGPAYLESLSKDLDILFILDSKPHQAGALFDTSARRELAITQDKDAYRAAMFVETLDGSAYIIASFEKTTLNAILAENRKKFLLLLVAVTLLTLAALRYFFTRRLIEPLKRLMEQIRRIDAGDYTPIPTLKTSDELETISANINLLAVSVSEREHALERSRENLEYLSHHDGLTNLPNRRFFMMRLEHAIEQARRHQRKIALLFLDLDQFKHVNDTLGHDVGDELLVAVARRLAGTIRSSDTLARIGGDEFNVLIENVVSARDVERIVQKMLIDFRTPFTCKQHEINTTASIGIAFYPQDGEDSITLIKNADLAMYNSKDEGRNSYSFFSRELSDFLENRTIQINALQSALHNGNEFHLLYQPKISLHTGRIAGIEALIRWNSPELGFVMPDAFIRLAEETEMIIPIGEWVLRQACSDFVALKAEGYDLDQVSINVSNVQLHHSDMVYTLKRIISQTGIAANEVELEITESFIVSHEDKALETLQQFRNMHVDLAIDDFGTGYSSLSYLQKLPMTRLKIDKSFVDDLPESQESIAVARAIIALAKTFQLSITAEGVENEAQLAFLRHESCDEIQGYYYSKPLDIDALKRYYTDFYAPSDS